MVFSGALFPTSILPWPISAGAQYLPFTQFIAAAREALLPGSSGDYASSMVLCIAGGTVFLAVGLWVYFASERKARKDGVLDRRLA
jgi:ABC-type polysaccharide/polyol phosphate export permease